MIVKINVGIGRFSKLWTGTVWNLNETIVDALIIERTCECGKSTRKFRAYPVQASTEAQQALELPELFVTGGGVGSIYNDPATNLSLQTWNWSKRIGGHCILNPVMVLSGYVHRDSLPLAREGYVWICTYSGSTLSEYALIRSEHEELSSHALPIVSLSGTCPPCREKAEEAAKKLSDVIVESFSPEVIQLIEQIKEKAPSCSSRKRRLLEAFEAKNQTELCRVLVESSTWIVENLQEYQFSTTTLENSPTDYAIYLENVQVLAWSVPCVTESRW